MTWHYLPEKQHSFHHRIQPTISSTTCTQYDYVKAFFILVAFACPLFHAHLSFLSSLFFLPETRTQSTTEESKNTKKTKTQHVSIFSKNPSNASQNTFTFNNNVSKSIFVHDTTYPTTTTTNRRYIISKTADLHRTV